MSSHALHISLLRPPILHILRAAGFQATRPAVVDTLVDLASRYLILIASKTSSYALFNHNELPPTIMDVRMALHDVGALWPEISIMEEQVLDEEDMRGMEGFIEWVKGEANQEIRRIAGLAPTPGEVVEIEAGEREDFLTVLKKKHSKTGEESRYQGSVLGKPAEDKPIIIEGGHVESIQAWEAKLQEKVQSLKALPLPDASSTGGSLASSPLSDI